MTSGDSNLRKCTPVVTASTTMAEVEKAMSRRRLRLESANQDADGYFVAVIGDKGRATGLQDRLADAFAEAIEEYDATTKGRRR